MSSKNRRELFAKQNLLNPTEETAAPTLREADSDLFRAANNKFAGIEDRKVTAQAHSIYEIYPDITQPRRAFPSVIRAEWDGDTKSLGNLLRWWEQLVNEERNATGYGEKFDVLNLLISSPALEGDDEGVESVGYLETSLMEIVQLANSILRDGLTNPITVMRTSSGNIFRLETGERRWLAYHLLATYFPDDSNWKVIPARRVETFNVWRQASENAARQDLNAIGKARQYAVLIMDLLSTERQTRFQPFDAFESEREYYAQVADGSQNDTPKGKAELLVNAMGLKNKVQLRQIRRLLRLPDEAWRLADDYNLQEGVVRRLMQEAGDDDELLTRLVVQEIQERVTPVTRSENSEGNQVKSDTSRKRPSITKIPEYESYRRIAILKVDLLEQYEKKKKQKIYQQIQDARKYLDFVENHLGDID